MSFETPIQVDLSQDNSWDQIDDSRLTPEDKALLKEQFNEDTEGIIYLTQQELWELKATLDATLDPRGEMWGQQVLWESFHEFIQQQQEESYTLWEIISGMEWIPEWADRLGNLITEITQRELFWSEGLMQAVDVSPVAQENISAALSVSILQTIWEQEDFSATNLETIATEYIEKLGSIGNVFSQTAWPDDGLRNNTLSVAQGGEHNSIFMNIQEGVGFFQGITLGEITQESMREYIEERNTQPWDERLENNLGEIQSMSQESLERVLALIESWDTQTWEEDENPDIDDLPTDPEERQSLIERWKESDNFILQILAALLEFGPAIGIDTEWNPDDNEDQPEPEEIAAQRIQQAREFFLEHTGEGIFVWITQERIEGLFPSSWDLPLVAQSLIASLERIPGEWDISEPLQHLFQDTLPSRTDPTQQVPRIQRFLSDMSLFTDSSISLNSPENLFAGIDVYATYRIRNQEWKEIPENATLERDMTFEEYFKENPQD